MYFDSAHYCVGLSINKMGFYYVTLLCTGTFVNQNAVIITKKIKIYSDQIIEPHEWQQGFVDLEELRGFIAQQHNKPKSWCGTCNDSSGIINEDIEVIESNGYDLFLEESCWCTLEPDSPPTSKYILVKNNYTYEIK